MKMDINLRTIITLGLIFVFLTNTFGPLSLAQAQEFSLPIPGAMVHLSPEFNPLILKGIKVHPDNPFRFDFILNQGDPPSLVKEGDRGSLKQEAVKLIKYFLASLTIPEKDLWVNLSPYEKNRIIPHSFGLTEMGRDLLAEDYMLKQITASLIYPEDEIGKKFWKRIYEGAAKKFGTTNIPVNTFNKVWIVPEKAVVYENAKVGTAYVVESKLKVMLEQDYLALEKNTVILSAAKDLNKINSLRDSSALPQNDVNALGSQIIREIVILELTKEVNEGKNFAQLRQVYNSLVLATWYKKKIKDSILAQVYENKNKIQGLSFPIKNKMSSPNALIRDPEHIYQQYLQAFKKGVYNYIKEEHDPMTQEIIPRKYFSGGVLLEPSKAMLVIETVPGNLNAPKDMAIVSCRFELASKDSAMTSVVENFSKKDVLSMVKALGLFNITSSSISSLKVSPDGKKVAVEYKDRDTANAKVFDIKTQKDIKIPFRYGAHHFIFSQGGKFLRVWYPGTSGEEVFDLKTRKSLRNTVSFNPDGFNHPNLYTFAPKGNYMAIKYGEGAFRLFDLETKRAFRVHFAEKIASYEPFVFSPDGQILAVKCEDTLQVVNLRSGGTFRAFIGFGYEIKDVIFSADGNFVGLKCEYRHNYTNYNPHVKVFDLRTRQSLENRIGTDVSNFYFSPDGQYLITEKKVKGSNIFNLTSNPKKDLENLMGPDFTYFKFSGNGQRLAVSYNNKTTKVFDLKIWKELQVPLGMDIRFYLFSQDGKYLAVEYHNKIAKIFDLESGQNFKIPIETNLNRPTYFDFSPNGRFLNTFDAIFDLKTRENIGNLLLGPNISSLQFSPDGRLLIAYFMGRTHNQRIFDLKMLDNPVLRKIIDSWKECSYFGIDILAWMVSKGLIKDKDEWDRYYIALDPIVRGFGSLVNDYNRGEISKLLLSSGILDYLADHHGDVVHHLSFYLELMRLNKRLALQVLEGFFAAIKAGEVSVELPYKERTEVLEFVIITHNFNMELYKVYKKEGKKALSQILIFAQKTILSDKAGPKMLNQFKRDWTAKGYDGDEILLAAILSVIPASGASFVKKEEIKGLFLKFLEAGDRRMDVPDALRRLGRFGGGTIQRMEWRLKKGEHFDADGRFREILNALRYPDSGKVKMQKEKDTKQDKEAFVTALKLLLADRFSTEKREKARQYFFDYARHNDLLKEKIDRIGGDDYQGLELLEQLLVDKDNLTVILRNIFKEEILGDGSEMIRDVNAVINALKAINTIKLDTRQKRKKIQDFLSRYRRLEIESKLMGESSILDTDIKDMFRGILKERSDLTADEQLQFIEDILKQPIEIVRAEKNRFEQVLSDRVVRLKFQVVKGPAFGLWVLNAGVCTVDLDLWKKKEFYLLAMIDEDRNEAVGFVHLFEVRKSGKLNLTVPGIEPSLELLGQVKAEEVFRMAEEALNIVAKRLRRSYYDIPTNPNILSNRTDFQRLVESRVKSGKYQKVELSYKVRWNTLPEPYPFNEVYRVPVTAGSIMRKAITDSRKDTAMLTKGGIDLTPAHMNLQTQNIDGEIKFHMDPAMLKQLQNAPGFVPVIINIEPMQDLKAFLGVTF